MKYVLDCIYLLALVAISPKIVYRMIRHNRYRSGWSERFGRIFRNEPAKKCIWIHAVSVGEVNATKILIDKLKQNLADYEIVVSSTTDTGFARAKAIYDSEHKVFYFPLDLSFAMRRAFKNIRPSICLLMELEVWPNFTATADKLNVPVVVVNGRISDKSFPAYKKITPFIKKTFQKVSLFLAQTDEYAERFITLGGKKSSAIVTGTLKYDTAEITDRVEGQNALAAALKIGDERLFVAGGTGPDEEQIILDVYKQLKEQSRFDDLRLAIVPRKPERFDEVAQLISQSGLGLVRYSQLKAGQNTDVQMDSQDVILGDTMGDLKKFYSLARIVFVGRSLVPMGGSDMMESPALGKCTIFGPHTFNFKQTVKDLLTGNGAIEVADGEELLRTMQKCLTDTDFAETIAGNGREVIKNNQGATEKSVKEIVKLLNSS